MAGEETPQIMPIFAEIKVGNISVGICRAVGAVGRCGGFGADFGAACSGRTAASRQRGTKSQRQRKAGGAFGIQSHECLLYS